MQFFLYKHVLEIDLPEISGVVRAKVPKFIPEVLSTEEMKAVLSRLTGVQWTIGCLLYGTGMRLAEAITEEDIGPLRDAMERVKENFLMDMEDSRNSGNISVKPEKE